MNPWLILGAGLILIATHTAVGVWQNGAGVDSQAVKDQAQFDDINKRISDQNTEANAKYRQAQQEVIDLVVERDTLKTKLEADRASNRKVTDDLRVKYSGLQLRFRAAETARPGCSGGGTESPPSGTPSNPSPAECVVSGEVTADLRAIAFDADTLTDDYKLLYEWAHSVR